MPVTKLICFSSKPQQLVDMQETQERAAGVQRGPKRRRDLHKAAESIIFQKLVSACGTDRKTFGFWCDTHTHVSGSSKYTRARRNLALGPGEQFEQGQIRKAIFYGKQPGSQENGFISNNFYFNIVKKLSYPFNH